ncbi:hypothetical protein ABN034_12850 [Actinopolymorpha sp. B11F2]|uniref:hypothetical protein n=1 Tax=Actinopolymorpha sp. B11F2 TaxID=3160862 RepID=UPI0032E4B549
MTTQVTGDHVARSVEAASTALSQLEHSLRAGGFAQGAAAYERMAEVLAAQHLFLGGDDPALADRFGQLGSTARRVFALLEPYASAMRKLAILAPERCDPREVAAVREQLGRRGKRGTSVSVLSRSTRLAPDKVERALAELVDEGTVHSRTVGDLTTYRLVPSTAHSPQPGKAGVRK